MVVQMVALTLKQQLGDFVQNKILFSNAIRYKCDNSTWDWSNTMNI